MEKWNDSALRQQIEEVITESYLRCLTEREIREYLKRFLDSCDCAVKDKSCAVSDARLTGIKVALLRGYFLLNGDEHPVPNASPVCSGMPAGRKTDRERFAEQVVSTRSTILRLIDDYNPKMRRMVLRRTGRGHGLRRLAVPGAWGRTALFWVAGTAAILLVVGYTLFSILFR